MIAPQMLAAGGALALVAGFAGGWTVRDWKADSDGLAAIAKAEKQRDRLQDRVDAAATQYEQWRASAQAGRVETRNTIQEIFRNAPTVPVECAAPDALVGLLDNQVDRANAAAGGQPVAALPGPSEATAPAD